MRDEKEVKRILEESRVAHAAAEQAELRTQLRTLKFSDEAIDLAVRARFRCEYCHRDLLASVEDYDAWQVDHVWPTSRGGSEDLENKALACKTCNFFKRAWVQSEQNRGTRADMIAAARAVIEERRSAKLTEVAAIRSVARELMESVDRWARSDGVDLPDEE